MVIEAVHAVKEHTVESALRELSSLKQGERFVLGGLFGAGEKAFFLASVFGRLKRPVLAILPTEEEAEDFYSDLSFFLKSSALLYPSTEVLPLSLQPTHPDIGAERVGLLIKLLDKETPVVAVASLRNLMQRVAPKETLEKMRLRLKEGEDVPRDVLTSALLDMGYSKVSMVGERGEMSFRGGIFDVFPTGFKNPVRAEFFGDTVESIRTFDIETQRSREKVAEATLLPVSMMDLGARGRERAEERLVQRADELGLNPGAWEPLARKISSGMGVAGIDGLLPLFYEETSTLFDYLSSEETLVCMVNPSRVEEEARGSDEDVKNWAARLGDRKEFFVRPEEILLDAGGFKKSIEKYPVLCLDPLGAESRIESSSNIALRQELIVEGAGKFPSLEPLARRIGQWLEEKNRVFITAHNAGQAERTRELLSGYGLEPKITKGFPPAGVAAGFAILTGALSSGFRLPSENLVLITEEEVFGERVRRRPPPEKKAGAFLLELQDLKEGDFIVHSLHGIGLYRGLKRLGVEGIEGDFLLLEYRDNDRLYLPVWKMDLVARYHGVEGGRTPHLDKLGTTGWAKTRGRVKKAIEKMAAELLKLYARREAAEGFAFSPPDAIFREFEAGFEYEETADQERAIEECIADMTGPRPMDRLVCGDVGYGKTEVALRAAFKAVLDSKQVAVLVPTTVLAQQHFLTFKKRFSPYPVTVEVLSRFRSRKEQAEVLKRLSRGEVDIIIGTHRLLQKDVSFKDLGLLVIDEEHRFGVAQKERLKRMKASVDVLALTATPIPRTLHMALASIRDMSVINTPPQDRLAVKTFLIPFDENIVEEAVERELKRGGQVFFVHNRIQTIGEVEKFLRALLPNARVAVAHGKTRGSELEKKMLAFVAREYDILLSTAIIESGLDIPTANTIIINRADRFGLADLYQLRGRVGRSRHRAYAYFISPGSEDLTEEARKRMEVIHELTEPGSGFRVAAYDLEIRGAGELLGTEQSGHIAEVGFDMYAELLDEAVRELKGEARAEEVEPEINIRVSQYIPEEYIPDMRQRLGIYKRLSSVSDEAELDYIREELADRFGEAPVFVENLVRTMELKLLLKKLSAKELLQKGSRLYISFENPPAPLVERAVGLAKKEPAAFRVTPEGRFVSFMKEGSDVIEEARSVLQGLASGCYS